MPIGAFEEWTGKPSRNRGNRFSNQHPSPPEWAYCPADRFVRLLEEADKNNTTLEKMQGSWTYPAEHYFEIGIRNND